MERTIERSGTTETSETESEVLIGLGGWRGEGSADWLRGGGGEGGPDWLRGARDGWRRGKP